MGPLEHARLLEEMREVKAALEQLTERQRSVFVLRHFQNLKLSEIAGVLNSPLGTVKATLNQTLCKLRSLLGIAGAESDSEDRSTESAGSKR